MIDLQKRATETVRKTLKLLAMGRPVGYAVTHCDVLTPTPQGEVGIQAGWRITVSLPNPLVGQADIAASVPLAGVVPPDAMFEQAARFCYGKAVEQLDASTRMPEGATMSLKDRPQP